MEVIWQITQHVKSYANLVIYKFFEKSSRGFKEGTVSLTIMCKFSNSSYKIKVTMNSINVIQDRLAIRAIKQRLSIGCCIVKGILAYGVLGREQKYL